MTFPILSTLMILPLFGILVISLIKGDEGVSNKNAKQVALLITIVNFMLSCFILKRFEYRYVGLQFEEIYSWIPSVETSLHFGVDGLSVYFVFLTNLLIPICILASYDSIKVRVKSYLMCFLFLQSMILGFFVSLNLFVFYIFFEAGLIPLFFIIGIWGGDKRIYASFKMFLYTLFGSLFFLIAIIKIYIDTGETDLLYLQNYDWPSNLEYILWGACFIAFAIKTPMVPFHTWLPLAHTQAPTAGSMILAGILLKMGGYGMIRLCLPVFPNASLYFSPYVLALSLVAILYTSLVALVQKDMKKLIAYSSIAHMGFVTLGIFSLKPQGISGAVVQMISHGIVSAALFMCVGIFYNRFHSREISQYGGFYKVMPNFGVIFLIFIFASAGLPGTSGFIGEMCILIGTYKIVPIFALIASFGVVLSAAYGLSLYRRLFLGPLNTTLITNNQSFLDISWFEKGPLLILVILSLYFG
ncbi:MAG: NADH-quinone oxidoreductase subunit M, partial [Proteobacteria bacterium]|nr:NADH-quinone oxidoreductase subunit M [Pseudomonadota bacterium]